MYDQAIEKFGDADKLKVGMRKNRRLKGEQESGGRRAFNIINVD
jgi:hypothetical protein